MGRIIIIGNGFDLAHGLKTSYADLMKFIKEETNPQTKRVGDCGLIHHRFKEKDNPFIGFKPNGYDFDYSTCKNNKSYYFQSLFNNYNEKQKWSDLETLYFDLIKPSPLPKPYNQKSVEIINNEFKYLKELLEYYLSTQIERRIADNYDFFRGDLLKKSSDKDDEIIGIINFNYTTKLLWLYIHTLNYGSSVKYLHPEFRLINIHGQLENKENPIILGYGDDNSSEYKQILNQGKNDLLVNFKTFQYLRNSSYTNVLSMLNSFDDIKIEIIGHSCGLTDKTLLRTIFEHKNVIKIEYRYYSDEKYYFDNLYNMSRIFTETSLMRQKLVDYSNTREIPQIKIGLLNDEKEIVTS